MQSGFNHILAEFQNLRSFLRGEFFHVAQQDHGAVVLGQFADGFFEQRFHFRAQSCSIGERGPIRDFKAKPISILAPAGHELIERKFSGGGEDALAALGKAGILGDAKDPGLDLFRFPQLVGAFEYFQQGFLGHFFGVLAVSAHKPAVLENPGAEIVDKTFEGLRFSLNQSPRKVDFVFPLQDAHPLLIVAGVM